MSLVGGNETQYTGLENDVAYDMVALGDQSEYPLFWEWNGFGDKSLGYMFPVMRFDEDHVPLGDSVQMCLGLLWNSNSRRF